MKNLFTLIAFIAVSVISVAQTEEAIESRNVERELTLAEKLLKPKPYTGKYTSAFKSGGGGSNDCFSFVPIPEDATELDFTANACDGSGGLDAAHGPFELDFSFCHFGDYYDEISISNKGNIQFGSCELDFVPAGFPNNGLPMVAAFWADVDMSCPTCGSIYYWSTPTAYYITWESVGYWNDVSTLTNTFQIVITDGTDPIVGVGNNVGLFYQDMQWASSNWNGGVNGFDGDAATVGANKGDGQNFVQFGRFISDSDDYDGPFGLEDGVHWLDDKAFVFNICATTDNIPPIANVTDNCDTIFICQNDTYEFNVSFNPPEGAQEVTVTVNDNDAVGWTETESGDGFINGFMEGSADNVGSHTLIFTGTDDGSPVASTSVTYIIEVIDVTLPDLVVTGDGLSNDIVSYCGGSDGAVLNASDGFDFYFWGAGEEGQEGTLEGGEYTLSAYLEGCEANYGPITVLELPQFNPDVTSESFTVCEGQSTVISADDFDSYTEVEWSVITPGDILSADLNAEEIEVTEGVYLLSVVDENGCPGERPIPIGIEQVQAGVVASLDCGDKEICWSGAWADPEECAHFIYLTDNGGDTWEGANIEVFINGIGPFNYSITNAATFFPTGFETTHNAVIEYFFTPGLDDDEIGVQIYNCENDILFDSNNAGDELVEGLFFTQVAETPLNAFTGTWTSSNPDGVFGCDDVFNPAQGTCCYSVPDDYIGTDVITFSADICPLDLEYNLLFSQDLEVSIDENNFELCSDEGGALVQPTYYPDASVDQIEYNWSPNFDCDGNPDCFVTASVQYSLVAENSCDEDEIDGIVNIIPVPQASLTDYSLCDNQSLTLSPVADDHPSFDYVWSTGSTSETITVADAGPHTVTVTNSCGTSEATAAGSVFVSPTVMPWVEFDTLVCAGSSFTLNPSWNGAEGTYIWSASYQDENGFNQVDTLFSETTSELEYSSEDFPENVQDVTLQYTLINQCGQANGSVLAYTDACFVTAYNIFTPDNDGDQNGSLAGGLNEGWQIIGIEGVAGVEVKVYDRWGALVYESDSYDNNNPWRGQHINGSDLADGVYFYNIKTPRGNQELNGSVTLLRNRN